MPNKTPKDIMEILHSIQDVRLDAEGNLEVKFTHPISAFPDGWEPNAGYDYGSFTRDLLDLIESNLQED